MNTSTAPVGTTAVTSFREANIGTTEEFIQDLPPMTVKRQRKYRTILTHVSEWWLRKPFTDVTKLDLKNVVIAINAKEDFKDWTKSHYKMATKRFFRWLRNQEFVEGIKTGGADETVGPEDILNDDELSIFYNACKSLRDKALSMTAYETACRPHEFLGLRKSDVAFDEYGAIVYVRKGKTGARRIRVINAAPLLSNWMENHPLKDRDAPLWVDLSSNTKFTALKWTGMRGVVPSGKVLLPRLEGAVKRLVPDEFPLLVVLGLAEQVRELLELRVGSVFRVLGDALRFFVRLFVFLLQLLAYRRRRLSLWRLWRRFALGARFFALALVGARRARVGRALWCAI